MAILLTGCTLPIGEAASKRVCACSLRSRLLYIHDCPDCLDCLDCLYYPDCPDCSDCPDCHNFFFLLVFSGLYCKVGQVGGP